jgi:hypothetical protein
MKARASEKRRPGLWAVLVVSVAAAVVPATSLAHVHGEQQPVVFSAGLERHLLPAGAALCPACRAAEQQAQPPVGDGGSPSPLESSRTWIGTSEPLRAEPRRDATGPRAPPSASLLFAA